MKSSSDIVEQLGEEAGGQESPPRKPRRHLKTVMLVVVVTTAAVLGIAYAWTRHSAGKEESPAGRGETSLSLPPSAPQWKMLELGVVKPAAPRWTDPLPARLKIDETKASSVGAPLAGRVNSVFIELGQRIKTGMPLFSIASPNIAGLRADLAKAAVDMAAAQNTLERVRAMVSAHAVPSKELVAAEQKFRQAELAHRLAVSKLSSLHVAGRGDNEFTVTAKRDGVIVEKNLLVGQEVSPESGKALVMIADLSTVWVLADLAEVDALQVKEKTRALITCPCMPGKTFEGKVDLVPGVVDPERHTIPIRVSLPNPHGLLRPNMFAQVRFSVLPDHKLPEIPAPAVVNDGDRQYVFVQSAPGQFSRRKVVTGAVQDGKFLVLSGLRLGETVVFGGAILLENYLAAPRQ